MCNAMPRPAARGFHVIPACPVACLQPGAVPGLHRLSFVAPSLEPATQKPPLVAYAISTCRQERFQGYICENSLKLKSVSRNSSQLGDTISSALDAAIAAGGNYLTVGGTSRAAVGWVHFAGGCGNGCVGAAGVPGRIPCTFQLHCPGLKANRSHCSTHLSAYRCPT